jgi:hypothetical protein
MCVFLRLVAKKMSDRFLEQKTNINFCLKLRKNASDTCSMLFEAYGGEAMKKSMYLSCINGSYRARMSKSQMMIKIITFLNIKGIFHSEFIP